MRDARSVFRDSSTNPRTTGASSSLARADRPRPHHRHRHSLKRSVIGQALIGQERALLQRWIYPPIELGGVNSSINALETRVLEHLAGQRAFFFVFRRAPATACGNFRDAARSPVT